jgi:uncharacterized phage protein gp47/JayE
VPTIDTKDFDTLVEEQATIIQGDSTRTLVDFTVGSILRAVVEAYSACAMWLQGLILAVLALTRASTSTGSDLDSWMADFGVARLGADPATGHVTFARFSPTIQAVVPVGATVQTADGSGSYAVTTDTTNSAYNAVAGGYVVPISTVSVTVPIQAVLAGSAANALANTVNLLGQAIVGIDTVNNASPVTGGTDAESDTALRARFVAYIASLSKAIRAAVEYAIETVDPALAFSITENETRAGVAQPGFFYVVIDDGTGSPDPSLLSNIYTAIDAIRPICSTFAVYGPNITTANVTMAITTSANHSAAIAAVTAALQTFIDSLPIGAGLKWSQLIQIAYDASSLVTDVASVQLNAGTSNIAGADGVAIRSGTVTVS